MGTAVTQGSFGLSCCSGGQPWEAAGCPEEQGAPQTAKMEIWEQQGPGMILPPALHPLQLSTHSTGSLCIILC